MSEPGAIENTQGPVSSENKKAIIPHAFVNSELAKARDSQGVRGESFGVLFADVDDTYYRPDRKDVSDKLSKIAEKNNIPIVAVTGNGFNHVFKRISNGELPYFSAIAGLVGTEVWVLHKDENGAMKYVKDTEYEEGILKKGFDRKALVVLANDTIVSFKDAHPSWGFDFQHPEVEASYLKGEQIEVEPFKISFFSFSPSKEDIDKMSEDLRLRFPNQKIVVSEDAVYSQSLQTDAPKRYCVDILPVTKADAVKYISDAMGVDVAAVAGDSGNDSDMLIDSGDISIEVGGSKPELDKVVGDTLADASASGRGSFRTVTKGGAKLYYRERDSNRRGPESIVHVAKILSRALRKSGEHSLNI